MKVQSGLSVKKLSDGGPVSASEKRIDAGKTVPLHDMRDRRPFLRALAQQRDADLLL